ncbi:50S ribosomal protein L10 [Paramaledivibacter caminithermalis]|jgi:large subunit ribosomal protein L10|uniref:Large ribosomal subunit protein uL10 n=1 Tax=Paramaledivibacter caminithermalis (strain DSM 15212 / CIP 107654 / DViRD3) TaxID=1121301 RepID=A0A1M6SK70_PARC5|nr:50S ribosomal protein L10 [Paramaledivibacter caminithermalis]SHK45057.1 LSU ribosomal protein L10P [Paramaledivibacter caminithermalis DSM 15212]
MSKAIETKKAVVNEIREKIASSQSAVLVDYRGLTVEETTELRKRFREAGVEYKVYKNSLMRFAFKEEGLEEFNQHLKGPNAIAFGIEDPVAPAKISKDFAKDHKNLEIKAGVVDGKVIDLDGVIGLADLPPREVLIAQVLGGLNGPISGFANVLQGNIRNLVYALNAIKEKNEQ